MSRIPPNNTPPSFSPLDVAPPSTAVSVFDATTGPSFNDHLYDASRRPTTTDYPEASQEDQVTRRADQTTDRAEPDERPAPVSNEPATAVSEEPSTATTVSDDSSHEDAETPPETNDGEKAPETVAGGNESKPKEDSKTNPQTEVTIADQTALPAPELETIVVTSAEETLPQRVETITDAKKPVEAVPQKSPENAKNILPAADARQGDQHPPTDAQEPKETKSSAKNQDAKQADIGEVVTKVSDTPEKTTTLPTKQTAPNKQAISQAEPSKTTPPPVQVKQVAAPETDALPEKSSDKASDGSVKEPERPTPIASRKQTAPTVAAEAEAVAPRATPEIEITIDPETDDGRRTSKSKKTTTTRGKAKQKIASGAATQPAAEPVGKPIATHNPAVSAEGIESIPTSEIESATQRVEIGGEDLKTTTRVGPRTVETAPEGIGRTTSEAKETTRTDPTRPHPEVDRTRFVQRVARAFNSMGSRGGTLRLRLSPPELGSLRIEIKVLDSTLTARIEAETSAARTVLIESLPALRERLAEQNIKIEQFDIDLLDQSPDDSSRQPTGNQDRDGEAGRFGNTKTDSSLTNETNEAEQISATVLGEDTQLNVVV